MVPAMDKVSFATVDTSNNKIMDRNTRNCDPKYSLRPILDLKSKPLAK